MLGLVALAILMSLAVQFSLPPPCELKTGCIQYCGAGPHLVGVGREAVDDFADQRSGDPCLAGIDGAHRFQKKGGNHVLIYITEGALRERFYNLPVADGIG